MFAKCVEFAEPLHKCSAALNSSDAASRSQHFSSLHYRPIRRLAMTRLRSLAFCVILLCQLVVACTLTAVSDRNTHGQPVKRIVQGYPTESIALVPHQVSLRRHLGKYFKPFCGGSIISDRWIITAAHCAKAYPVAQILAGVGSLNLSSGGDVYSIREAVLHHLYLPSLYRNDIGLLRLNKSFRMNRGYAAIPLCAEWIGEEVHLRLSGWGKTGVRGLRPTNRQQRIEEVISITFSSLVRTPTP